ncbi:MAG: hydrogen peroxide-dependent heme synthase [Planctomycetota bacterium]
MKSIEDLGLESGSAAPAEGWHCTHFFYTFDRRCLAALSQLERNRAKAAFVDVLSETGTLRCQSGVVAGHKADFSLMVMDPDPVKVESVHQRLMGSAAGAVIQPAWSYVSLSEISEYVQSPDQYAERLKRAGEDPSSSAFEKKMAAYAARLEKMNVQRLTPVFPDWPVSCFYPMNKWRYPGANWFTLSTSERHKLMSEHARSGIKFAGKVTQLITVGVGLDDWEWGVTLWATNPLHLKQIVYDMRFDEASAKYAEFGPFYTTYHADARKIIEICSV